MSDKQSSFGKSFNEARNNGQDTFNFAGNTYTTQTREEANVSSSQQPSTIADTSSSISPGNTQSFGGAFKEARDGGQSKFDWQGNTYTTQTKEEANTNNTNASNTNEINTNASNTNEINTNASNTNANNINTNTNQDISKQQNIVENTHDEKQQYFSEAFKKARDSGQSTFDWKGNTYTTQTKEDANADISKQPNTTTDTNNSNKQSVVNTSNNPPGSNNQCSSNDNISTATTTQSNSDTSNQQDSKIDNNNIKKIGSKGIDLIKKCEGYHPQAYFCPAGVPTIGYGHTKSVTEDDITNKKTIDESQADEYLQQDVNGAERCVFENVNENVKRKLNQNQFDALTSFVFNIGSPGFKSSTLLKKLNAGDIDEASQQFKVWNKATNSKTGKKEELKGLTNRRKAEEDLFNSKD